MAGISIWQLMIILVIVMLIFGTKKLKNIGSDLGGAVKGFKNSMAAEENKTKEEKKIISEKKEADIDSQKTESKENQNI